ncbi:MAG: TonB family protein, partial [Candidatus Acidiferrales bacterium]
VLPPEPLVDLRLQLPRSSKRLETKGKVAWTSGTKKEAGVEFIDLPEEVRLEIREWLASENLEPVYIENAPNVESSARPPARRDKWTNLVSELSSIPAGIDRVTDDRTASARPATVAESFSTEKIAAPACPDLNAMTANPEPIAATPVRDLGLAESLTAESLIADRQNAESDSESNSIAAPELADRLSSNPDPIADQQYRKGDLELSLPSDKLLNTALHPIAIVPSRGNKFDNAKPSRNLRPSGADDSDAFLRKARALFGPKHLDAPQQEIPETDDSASSLESVEPAPAALPAEAAAAEHAPAPMSDLIATSIPAREPFIPSALRPVASIPLDPSASRVTEPKHRPASLPPSHGLDLRSFLSILALCVLLSVVCLAFGIVVGRGVATHSQNATAYRDDMPARSSQSPAAQGQDSSISNRGNTLPALSQGHNQPPGRTSAQRAHETTHRRASASRLDDTSSASLAGENDAPAENATVGEESTKSSITPSSAVAAASPTGASTALSPKPPAASVAAPRSQPPSDRMVAAYLIYRVEPIYPRPALQAGVEGTVKIHATVGRDGSVKNLKGVSGPALLTSAAIDAAQYWRYRPALRNGEPVETDA